MSAIADTAAGYAAVSLMPPARGEVVKAGRTLTVVQTDVFTEAGGTRKLIALLVATIMMLEAKGGFSD